MFIRLLIAASVVSASVLLATPAGAASVAGPAALSAVSASLTTRDLDGLASQIDVLAAAGAFRNSGIAQSLKGKVNSARKPAERGDAAAVNRIMNAFANDVSAQRGQGIAASAADALVALASGRQPSTVVAVKVGAASVVATQVGGTPVVVALPAGTPVAWMRFGSASDSPVPSRYGRRRLDSIEVTAYNVSGQTVSQLGGSALLSIGFRAALSVNTGSAEISTLTSSFGGQLQTLATTVVSGADAFTATASIVHLSPFVIDALTTTPPWRYSYLPPPAITSITPSGTVCGGSTITLNGSGFSNVNAVTLFTNPMQSFTVVSDSQITAVTNADALAPENVATRVYLTTTGFPPERANLGQPFPPFFMEANAGPNNPGTPTFSGTTDPTVPRITGMKPNQGPTIGAPAGPSQNFTNDPITLWGCGFTGATAVLFGATASPGFTVQSDTVIFATPPTPASGTVDVTVVTPRGTSSIIP